MHVNVEAGSWNGAGTKVRKLTAPFPWFGGKSRIASLVWSALGDVPNYVEPFFGSGAVLLARPHAPGIETVNDLDCYLVNFWRAVKADPAGVAKHADYPVSEADLTARHQWLVDNAELRKRVFEDPEYYDVKAVGWWVWGQSSWIGRGWCDSDFYRNGNDEHGKNGVPVHRKRPHLGSKGQGINGSAFVSGSTYDKIYERMLALQKRLRRVRICCGSWERVLTRCVTTKHGVTGVFLDPPYATKNSVKYSPQVGEGKGDPRCARAVARWAFENGDNPDFRIVLCGYEGEHKPPKGWRTVAWKGTGGYYKAKWKKNPLERHNGYKERLWLSPHCVEDQRFLFYPEE